MRAVHTSEVHVPRKRARKNVFVRPLKALLIAIPVVAVGLGLQMPLSVFRLWIYTSFPVHRWESEHSKGGSPSIRKRKNGSSACCGSRQNGYNELKLPLGLNSETPSSAGQRQEIAQEKRRHLPWVPSIWHEGVEVVPGIPVVSSLCYLLDGLSVKPTSFPLSGSGLAADLRLASANRPFRCYLKSGISDSTRRACRVANGFPVSACDLSVSRRRYRLYR